MFNDNTDRIKNLIAKHILHDLNEDEAAELESWRQDSQQNNEFLSRLSDPEYLRKRYQDFVEINSEEASHGKQVRHSRFIRWGAAALAAAAVVLAVLLLPKLRTPKLMTVTAPHKGIASLVLPDGSKVWMKSASSITYPEKFYGSARNVSFSGEGYFEVSSSEENPFIVSADGFKVKVTGTKLDIKSYRDDKVAVAALIEGEVTLIYTDSLGNEVEDKMVGGELSMFDKTKRSNTLLKTNTSIYSSWIGGVYSFESETLEEILRQVCRYYGYNLIVSDSSVKDRVLSGRLKMGENANSIIEAFQEFLPGHIKLESDTIIIQ